MAYSHQFPESLNRGQDGASLGRLTEEDQLRQALQYWLTPHRERMVAGPEAGAHAGSFGPSREMAIGPQDMQMAAGLMELLRAREDQETEVERERLAMDVLRPTGGGEMSMPGQDPVQVGGGAPGPMSERDRWAASAAGIESPDRLAGRSAGYGAADTARDMTLMRTLQRDESTVLKALRAASEEEVPLGMDVEGRTPMSPMVRQLRDRLSEIRMQIMELQGGMPGGVPGGADGDVMTFDAQGNLVP